MDHPRRRAGAYSSRCWLWWWRPPSSAWGARGAGRHGAHRSRHHLDHGRSRTTTPPDSGLDHHHRRPGSRPPRWPDPAGGHASGDRSPPWSPARRRPARRCPTRRRRSAPCWARSACWTAQKGVAMATQHPGRPAGRPRPGQRRGGPGPPGGWPRPATDLDAARSQLSSVATLAFMGAGDGVLSGLMKGGPDAGTIEREMVDSTIEYHSLAVDSANKALRAANAGLDAAERQVELDTAQVAAGRQAVTAGRRHADLGPPGPVRRQPQGRTWAPVHRRRQRLHRRRAVAVVHGPGPPVPGHRAHRPADRLLHLRGPGRGRPGRHGLRPGHGRDR